MVNNAIVAICGIQGAAVWTNCLKNDTETFSNCNNDNSSYVNKSLRFYAFYINDNLFTTSRADWSKSQTVYIRTCIYLIYWKDLDFQHSMNGCRNRFMLFTGNVKQDHHVLSVHYYSASHCIMLFGKYWWEVLMKYINYVRLVLRNETQLFQKNARFPFYFIL